MVLHHRDAESVFFDKYDIKHKHFWGEEDRVCSGALQQHSLMAIIPSKGRKGEYIQIMNVEEDRCHIKLSKASSTFQCKE